MAEHAVCLHGVCASWRLPPREWRYRTCKDNNSKVMMYMWSNACYMTAQE